MMHHAPTKIAELFFVQQHDRAVGLNEYIEFQIVGLHRLISNFGRTGDVAVPALQARAVAVVNLKNVVPAVGIKPLDEYIALAEDDKTEVAFLPLEGRAQAHPALAAFQHLPTILEDALAPVVTFFDGHGRHGTGVP
jgi:hypothetical protein